MQQLITLWQGFDTRRRAIIALATIGMFAAVIALAQVATRPTMTLLYGGLDSAAAGDVITALEARGLPHRVQGDSIFVDAQQRDALRMALASEGLPASGTAGYELLDGLNGFGTTSQMFNATYLRAKEGELARTIQASPQIRQARVHITEAANDPFRRDLNPTASVSIGTASPGGIDTAHAQALQFLVASAVSGLEPEDVAIIDERGHLISVSPEQAYAAQGTSLADRLSARVERMLEARVGPGNALVEISIDRVNERESIVERLVDPDSRVAISAETQETTATARNSETGITVASDLPEQADGGGGESSEQSSETVERINYEVSETLREVLRTPGGIRRLTVAVLVNGTPDAQGTLAPRDSTEIAALQELVEDVVGFDAARGDQITLQSMVFVDSLPPVGTAAPGWLSTVAPAPESLVRLGVLAVVALILGLFVLRPMLRPAPPVALPALAPPGPSATAMPGLDGEINPDASLPSTDDALAPPDPVARMRAMIDARRDETMAILRNWLDEEQEISR